MPFFAPSLCCVISFSISQAAILGSKQVRTSQLRFLSFPRALTLWFRVGYSSCLVLPFVQASTLLLSLVQFWPVSGSRVVSSFFDLLTFDSLAATGIS